MDELEPPAPPAPVRQPLTADEKEAWAYLEEAIKDYERYLSDLDNLGLAAPNVLYYRDDIQDLLDEFKGNDRVDFRGAWLRVKALDEVLRAHQDRIVAQIGHANFKQYQIVNDPPRTHWWWFLNRVVAAPPPPPSWWQFWKKDQLAEEKPSEPQDASSGQDTGDGLGVPQPPV